MSVYLITALCSLIVAAGFNLFLVPHRLLSGGLSGVSMLVGYAAGWNIGLLYFLFNLPILVWGLVVIGKRFVVLSVFSVVLITWFMQIIPVDLYVNDSILASVFGGVLIGIGTGFSLRVGGSSGGFDIVGLILTRRYDFPLGNVLFGLNGAVILALGYPDNWDHALYSMLSIYITGKIVDSIHVRHIKVTCFIVTNRTAQMLERLLQLPRGVTIMKTQGAYTNVEKDMLMTVTTRYELAELRKIIQEIDPKAFVNIVETVEVIGDFRKSK
ncbi:YitT family protein [Ferviditalea candida]|uniref:YitT family protein n=1 Tax=Ferviditalea candida TaxID=3108399 RepID=A0ABU5ZCL4_9BACL|nr:YitT family protein [Paenibacillaceae bacterium T2]